MRLLALLGFAGLLAACGGATPTSAVEQPPGNNAFPARGAAVAQGEPNKTDAVPAFPEQIRALESKSGVTLEVETIADGIANPWGSAILPDDGAIIVTSKAGKLWLVAPGKPKTEVTGVPRVDTRDQGGLLDVSVGPDFMTARTVYFSFSEDRGGGKNRTSLAMARLSADHSKLENGSTIFR
jgi:glucose/arabinose dehydrogenase